MSYNRDNNNDYEKFDTNNMNMNMHTNNPNNNWGNPNIQNMQNKSKVNYHHLNQNFQNYNQNYPYAPVEPLEDYEELKSAYMNQLMSGDIPKNMNNNNMSNNKTNNTYTGGSNSISGMSDNQTSEVKTMSQQYNNMSNVASQNTNIYGRPMSEKLLDKEIKRKQQEEYRKFLDFQLREQNERKERMRLEKKGIFPDDRKSEVGQNPAQSEAEFGGNRQSSNITNISSNNIKRNALSAKNSEKELEKQKKMQYQNQLLQQIEERKKRQEEEKKRRLEEELKYESKFVKPEVEEKKGRKSVGINSNNSVNTGVNYNYSNNSSNPPNSQHNNTGTNANIISQNQNQNPNINSNQVDPAGLTDEYFTYKQNLLNNNTPNGSNYHYNNTNHPLPNPNQMYQDEHNYYQKEENNNQKNMLNSQEYGTINSINNPIVNPIPNTYNPFTNNIYNNTYKSIPSNQHLFSNAPSTNNLQNSYNYNPIQVSSQRTNAFNQTGSPMIPPFFEEMLKYFFQEQVKVINQYKNTLDKIADERDNAIFQNLATREKMMAMNQLKLEQERFKSNLGFYPFDNNYNKNIEDMFNNMIENNFNTKVQNPHSYEDNRPISGLKSSNINAANNNQLVDNKKTLQNHSIGNNVSGNIKNPSNVMIDPIDFRSKYEDLTESMMSFNFELGEEENHHLKKSLQGESKFVCINPKEVTNSEVFLTTWRQDDTSRMSRFNPDNARSIVDHMDKIDKKNESGLNIDHEEDKEDVENNLENLDNENNHYYQSMLKDIEACNESEYTEVDIKNYEKSKSMNLPVNNNLAISNNLKNFRSQRDYENLVISKEEKDKSLILEDDEMNMNYLDEGEVNNCKQLNKFY